MELPTDGRFSFGIRKTFVPKERISEGGFGSVWALDDDRLVCKFALKDEALENESRVLDTIHARVKQQPHLSEYIRIPRVVEFGTCFIDGNRREYIVMERFGADLSNLKDIHFSTELNRVYAILRAGLRILKGLYVMHVYLKLVHGDVKPSNFIFIDPDFANVSTDELAFIDLGLARPVKDKSILTSGINGTRSYASIHVQKKFLPTPRCDLESLGYMLLGFIDQSLPWNREIKQYMKRKKIAPSAQDEEEPADLKLRKEQIALGQKRELKRRILEERYNSDGENILAEYFYTIYHTPIVPDSKVYKLLCKTFYSTLKRLQNIAIEAQRTSASEFQNRSRHRSR